MQKHCSSQNSFSSSPFLFIVLFTCPVVISSSSSRFICRSALHSCTCASAPLFPPLFFPSFPLLFLLHTSFDVLCFPFLLFLVGPFVAETKTPSPPCQDQKDKDARDLGPALPGLDIGAGLGRCTYTLIINGISGQSTQSNAGRCSYLRWTTRCMAWLSFSFPPCGLFERTASQYVWSISRQTA